MTSVHLLPLPLEGAALSRDDPDGERGAHALATHEVFRSLAQADADVSIVVCQRAKAQYMLCVPGPARGRRTVLAHKDGRPVIFADLGATVAAALTFSDTGAVRFVMLTEKAKLRAPSLICGCHQAFAPASEHATGL